MTRERHNTAFFVGAIVGGLAGTAYALWTAPQAGARTRAQLAERLAGLTARAGQTIATVRAESAQLIERAVETVSAFAGPEPKVPLPAHREPAVAEDVILIPEPGEPAPPAPVPGAIEERPAPPADADIVIEGPRPTMGDR